MNLEAARTNMINQQIRACEVLDDHILETLRSTPRENFVPANYEQLAFADLNIPLGHGQVMMTPLEESQLIQALNIQPTDTILEVGTGSGYLTALLCKLGKYVYSVDIQPEFTNKAKKALAAEGLHNFTLETGDAAQGWGQHAPYDVIVLTGSVPELADTFRESLAPGGKIFAVIGKSPVMHATLITATADDAWQETKLFETDIHPLCNAVEREKFTF